MNNALKSINFINFLSNININHQLNIRIEITIYNNQLKFNDQKLNISLQ